MSDTPRVEAIDRALSLLLALADAGPQGASLTDLAADTDANKSTAYRALATLRARGFATQAFETGHYLLGPIAMGLGERFVTPQHLATTLHPALLALSRMTDELVHLGVLVDDQVLYIDKVEPERPIRVWSAVGRRVPAATSALGRALLAARGVPDKQLAAYVRGDRHTEEIARLRRAVELARRLGYASEQEETEPGVACVALAILQEGQAIAALSITTLTERLTAERQQELAELARTHLPALLPEGLSLTRAAG